MKYPRTFRHVFGFGLLILSPCIVWAHQISLIRADAVVHRDKLDITLTVLPEDVMLSAGAFKIVSGWVAKADILKGADAHPKFLLDGLIILDEDGHRLDGKVTSIDLPPVNGDRILADDLLATTIVYRVEYPLAKPPARLSFQQHYNTA